MAGYNILDTPCFAKPKIICVLPRAIALNFQERPWIAGFSDSRAEQAPPTTDNEPDIQILMRLPWCAANFFIFRISHITLLLLSPAFRKTHQLGGLRC